jgi:hypothetical protein
MRRTAIVLVGLLAVSAPALAGEIADKAAEAERQLGQGNAAEAFSAFDQAQDALWQQMPMIMRRVVLAEKVDGFGLFTPRADNRFKPGEKLLIYMEPVGFSYKTQPTGENVIQLAIDVELVPENGTSFGKVENVASVDVASINKPHDFYFNFTLTLDSGSVPPGKYHGNFILRDRNSSKSAPFSLDFEIVQ